MTKQPRNAPRRQTQPAFGPPPFAMGEPVKLSREGLRRGIGGYRTGHYGTVVECSATHVTVQMMVVGNFAVEFWESMFPSNQGASVKPKQQTHRPRSKKKIPKFKAPAIRKINR